MTQKKKSGYQFRKEAAERRKAAGILAPPPLPTIEDVSSLTALTSTRLRYLCEWLKKKLSTEDFGVFVKTLSEFRADAVARIQEREIENDERMADLLEAHEARAAGLTLMQPTALEQAPGPIGGELVARETKPAEVSE